jgi:ferritin
LYHNPQGRERISAGILEDTMKINKKVEDAINKQLNAEFYSAYLYLGMSSRCTELNLKGMANWFYVQAQEEMTHAVKFYRFVLDRGGHPVMPAIDGVRTDWKTSLEMFAAAYEHEKVVTGLINNIADIALAERDHATASMLNWFIDEQVEEEANSSEITEKLKLIGESRDGLFMLDKELSARVFVDRTQPAGGAQA